MTPAELETDLASDLLAVVEELARELHPRQRRPALSLDSSLEADAGIDSLARVELLPRIERRLGVRLPERVAVSAETPRDLLRAAKVGGARPTRTLIREEAPERVERAEAEVPVAATTLIEALSWHVARHPDRVHLRLYGEDAQDDDDPEPMTYAELLRGAEELAAGLRAADLQPGESVALMLATSREFFFGFYGTLLAGGVPVPVYPPARPSQLEAHLRRQVKILDNAQARILLTLPEAKRLGPLVKANLPGLQRVATVSEMTRPGERARVLPRASDVAFLQYTSGSTGAPKGVVLTHANLLASLRAMGEVIEAGPNDVFVSWLPLYHDMGLIGGCLAAMYYGFPLVLMSPLAFIAKPSRWVRAVHRHRGTLSASPNFGYEVSATRLADEEVEGLDLSSWRVAFNGAEPVSPGTLDRFTTRFAPHGFRPEAMTPVYGLAETSLGLTFPPLGRGPLLDRIARDPFVNQGRAEPAEVDDPLALRFVSCGRPLPRHEVRIVDPGGHEAAEREVGRLHFRGPSATSGYNRNREATAKLIQDGWLDSGDMAYIAEGEVFVTGRVKDLIIKAGRNLYPDELEQVVGDLPGIRKGCVAVFGVAGPDVQAERLIVLAETRETDPEAREVLRREVIRVATDVHGVAPDEVVLAPPQTVLKTSSGKIRRSACKELYERGALGQGRAVWWQLVRFGLTGVGPTITRGWRRATGALYALWAWLVAALLIVPGTLAVVLFPSLRARRWAARATVRLAMLLTGLRPRIHGWEHADDGEGPRVFVANHSSYIDALILTAVLPTTCAIVAKRELTGRLYTRVLLARLGHLFVERFDAEGGLRDVERAEEAARSGSSVAFFPEGTFVRAPGLREFRMGAFLTAVRARVPVVPVAIRGSRSVLRGDDYRLRRGPITIRFGAPIEPGAGEDWVAAIGLRDAARAVILSGCGEPDLDSEAVAPPPPA